MNARLTALRERALARWTAAGTRERALFLAAIATVVALGVLGYSRASRVPMSVLFSGLAEADAADIVARLRESHVPYELAADGGTILVPTSSVDETRLSLASEGLPAGGGVGFEIFDTQRFGESEFVEQVQYLRALEGELSRTIGALDGVESARVHLVLPQRTLLGGEGEHARASIAVRMRAGHRLVDDSVRGIVHLVASSVRDLDPANVTVVDGEGRRLASGDDTEESAESARDAEALRQRIERARERAVQDLLDTTLGPGVAVVRLAADVSFSHEERLEESFDPDRTATRSFELTTEGSASAEDEPSSATSGVAGAVSALPGGPAAEDAAQATDGVARRTEVRNFEVTKLVRREVEPLGRVTRLSLAVVVDGTYEGEGDERHFVPRSEQELERIRAVVSSAAGLRESRGDTLTVECVPFATPPALADADVGTPGALASSIPAWQLGTGALVAVAAIVGTLVVLARRRRRRAAAAQDATPSSTEKGLEASSLAPSSATPLVQVPGEPETPDAEAVRIRVIDLARRDPELTARIVRGWLAAEAEPSGAETGAAAPAPG